MNALPLPLQQAWRRALPLGMVALLIFMGRMGWWLYWGTLLEIDSLGYVELQANLYHPPLYSAFTWAAIRLGKYVDAVVVLQSLFYSFCAALVLVRTFRTPRWLWLVAVVLAVEPCSGKLACTVMSETLFLGLVLLAFADFQGLADPRTRRWVFAAAWPGLILGLAHMTRYAAPVFLVAVVGGMILHRLPWRRLGMATVILLATFQLELLPLRLYYHQQFGTWEFNAFSGASFWNTTAHLYPDSRLRGSPGTDFEQHLAGYPDSLFDIPETWHTNHIFHDSLPFQRYVQERDLGTAAIIAASHSAGATGRRLLMEFPGRHIQRFVIPNMLRPFHVRDQLFSDLLPVHIRAPLWRHHRMQHDYLPGMWRGIFLLLLGTTAVQLIYRKKLAPLSGTLLLAVWLYLAGIAGLAVIFLRFVYVLAPMVILALGIQLDILRPGRKA
jgi:hypothetical protein